MSQSEFPRHLIDEADRLLIQIRAAGDQIDALVSRARDVLTLAKRTILENGKFDHEMEIGERRIRQADTAIEREAQREVERREQAIDEGRIIPRGGSYAADAALRTEERMAKREGVAPPRWEDLTDQERAAIAPVVHGITALMTAEDRAATMKDIAELSGEGDAARDIVRNIAEPDADEITLEIGLPAGLTDSEMERHIDQIASERNEAEESLPGQAEGVNTGAAEELSPQPAEAAPVDTTWPEFKVATIADNSVRSVWPSQNEHAAADEPTVPAGDAHDEAPAGPQVSAEMKGPAETAAEEAKVIPPEDFSAADEKPPLGDRFYREKAPAEPTQEAVDTAARERQNANAREASEFSDKVLDLWSTTLLTEVQIAKRLATGKALIMTVLEQARLEQDPRVTGKRGVQPKPKEYMPLSAIARKIMDRPAPVAAKRAGVEIGKFDPPTKGGEKSSLISTGVCVVDVDNGKIYGKRGVWTADRKIIETVVKLNGGQMYGKAYLTTACGWRDERELTDAITPMMERLRDIGIVMTSLPTGIVIRVDD